MAQTLSPARGALLALVALTTLGLVLVAAIAPADAGARKRRHSPLSGSQIVAKLNKQRERIGLPAEVSENPTWSRKCRAHNRYMLLNGYIGHDEIPGRRGFSEGGQWAGQHAVLAGIGSWRRRNPWANAPLHLSQIYNPALRVTGTSESYGRQCMTSFPGWDPEFTTPTETIFSFPADGGRAPYAQHASEYPYTPQTKVGISERATTGPHIYLWAASPPPRQIQHTFEVVGYDEYGNQIYADPNEGIPDDAPLERLVAGSLVDAGGHAVRVKLIDNEDVDGLVGPGAGFILPVKPLHKRTTYTVTATFATAADAEDQHEFTRTFSFRTTGRKLR